jgi:hypothetical protein
VREFAWWPRLKEFVSDYIRRCSTCAFTKLTRIQAGAALSVGNGEHPGDIWTYDILTLDEEGHLSKSGHRKVLVFIDRFSRWMVAEPLTKDQLSSAAIFDIFIKRVVSQFGYPRAMLCDRGSNLMQGEAPACYEIMGIRLVAADAGQHSTVGLVERFHQTLIDIIRCKRFEQDNFDDWTPYLAYAALLHNTTIHEGMCYSPFFVVHGRDAMLPIHLTLASRDLTTGEPLSDFVSRHVQVIHQTWADAKANLGAVAAKIRSRTNKSRDIQFEVKRGDRVLLRKRELEDKLDVPYEGPYRVVDVLNDGTRVRLRDLHRVMHDIFPISRIKLFPYEDNDGHRGAESAEYEIQDIVDQRERSGPEPWSERVEYLIKFKGYSRKEWVPRQNLNEGALELAAAFTLQQRENELFKARRQGHAAEYPELMAGQVDASAQGVAKAFRSHRQHHVRCAPEGALPTEADTIPEPAFKYRYDQDKPKQKRKKQSHKKMSEHSIEDVREEGDAALPVREEHPLAAAVPELTPEEFVEQSDVYISNAAAAAKVRRRKPVTYNFGSLSAIAELSERAESDEVWAMDSATLGVSITSSATSGAPIDSTLYTTFETTEIDVGGGVEHELSGVSAENIEQNSIVADGQELASFTSPSASSFSITSSATSGAPIDSTLHMTFEPAEIDAGGSVEHKLSGVSVENIKQDGTVVDGRELASFTEASTSHSSSTSSATSGAPIDSTLHTTFEPTETDVGGSVANESLGEIVENIKLEGVPADGQKSIQFTEMPTSRSLSTFSATFEVPIDLALCTTFETTEIDVGGSAEREFSGVIVENIEQNGIVADGQVSTSVTRPLTSSFPITSCTRSEVPIDLALCTTFETTEIDVGGSAEREPHGMTIRNDATMVRSAGTRDVLAPTGEMMQRDDAAAQGETLLAQALATGRELNHHLVEQTNLLLDQLGDLGGWWRSSFTTNYLSNDRLHEVARHYGADGREARSTRTALFRECGLQEHGLSQGGTLREHSRTSTCSSESTRPSTAGEGATMSSGSLRQQERAPNSTCSNTTWTRKNGN